MLEKCIEHPWDGPFSGDTPLDDFECGEIGVQLRRLLMKRPTRG